MKGHPITWVAAGILSVLALTWVAASLTAVPRPMPSILPTVTPHPPPSADTPVVSVTVDDLFNSPASYADSLIEVEGLVFGATDIGAWPEQCDVERGTEIYPPETSLPIGPPDGKRPIFIGIRDRSAIYRVRGWFLQGTCQMMGSVNTYSFWYIAPTSVEFLRERGW